MNSPWAAARQWRQQLRVDGSIQVRHAGDINGDRHERHWPILTLWRRLSSRHQANTLRTRGNHLSLPGRHGCKRARALRKAAGSWQFNPPLAHPSLAPAGCASHAHSGLAQVPGLGPREGLDAVGRHRQPDARITHAAPGQTRAQAVAAVPVHRAGMHLRQHAARA